MPLSFRNWAGNHRARPESLERPRTEAEIAAALQRAERRGRRVRAVGAAHSWTDIACTDEVLLSLDRMRRVLAIDQRSGLVTVEGGIRLFELNEILARYGLAFENLGSVAEQSVAGAIATGTHGTGLGLGNLSTQVRAVRLVTPSGRVVEATAGSDADLFSAARLSLGTLGIASAVAIQTVPAYRLKERAWPVSFEEALASLGRWVREHERVKLWWLPHTDRVQVFTYERTREPASTALSARLARAWEHSGLLYGVFTALLRAGARWPERVPAINRLVAATYFKPAERVDRSDRLLNIAMPPRHLEVEYAIEVAAAETALERLRALIAEQDLRVGFVVEVRFVAADDLLLSPARGRETCMIIAGMPAGSRDVFRWFRGFERTMLALDGRPHWGKAFTLDTAGLRACYPTIDRFDRVRRALDVRGTLTNAFTERVFGRARAAGTPTRA